MKTALLKIASVKTDAGTQVRAAICEETVSSYAEAMLDGAQFPPLIVFHDGNNYILADGFHRLMAAARNGFTDFEFEVRQGVRSDALKYALSANTAHGLKRSNADKRRSVEMALGEWPNLSDRELSKICAVSDKTVGEVRINCGISAVETKRIGADGKERSLPKKAESKEPEAKAPDEPKAKEPTPDPTPAKPAKPAKVVPAHFIELSEDMEVVIADCRLMADDLRTGEVDLESLKAAGLNLQVVARKISRFIKLQS